MPHPVSAQRKNRLAGHASAGCCSKTTNATAGRKHPTVLSNPDQAALCCWVRSKPTRLSVGSQCNSDQEGPGSINRRNKGGQNEDSVCVIGATDHWVHGRKQRTGQCRSLLPIRFVSGWMRRKARRCAAAATSRASCGAPRRRCGRCRSAARNTDESRGSG